MRGRRDRRRSMAPAWGPGALPPPVQAPGARLGRLCHRPRTGPQRPSGPSSHSAATTAGLPAPLRPGPSVFFYLLIKQTKNKETTSVPCPEAQGLPVKAPDTFFLGGH